VGGCIAPRSLNLDPGQSLYQRYDDDDDDDDDDDNNNNNNNSSVGIALGYGLDGRGSRVQFPAWAGKFSLHHRIQNGSGAHPASYPMGTRGSFPGAKAAGA
jgi:hypothetical protein